MDVRSFSINMPLRYHSDTQSLVFLYVTGNPQTTISAAIHSRNLKPIFTEMKGLKLTVNVGAESLTCHRTYDMSVQKERETASERERERETRGGKLLIYPKCHPHPFPA